MMRAAVLIAALLLAGPAAAQSLYKWVDEKGVTHYTQEPPDKGKAEKLEVKVEPAKPRDADDWKARDLESRRRKVQGDTKARAEDERKAYERQARCERAKAQFDQLRYTRRIYRLDDKGERVYVEDDQRPAMIEKAQAEMRESCS